jgi:hypothetical protein
MTSELLRRDIVQSLIGISAIGLLAKGTTSAMAQTGVSPVKVDTKGLVAKIKFEAVLGGFLSDLNDRYKLRVTELTLEARSPSFWATRVPCFSRSIGRSPSASS